MVTLNPPMYIQRSALVNVLWHVGLHLSSKLGITVTGCHFVQGGIAACSQLEWLCGLGGQESLAEGLMSELRHEGVRGSVGGGED